MSDTHTYTVRQPGMSAWSEGRTLAEAAADAKEARDRGLRPVVIVREADSVIVDTHGDPIEAE